MRDATPTPTPPAEALVGVVGGEPPDPRAVVRLVTPGRVLGIGLDLWSAVLDAPSRAATTMRVGLREARALHSRERRLVGDVLRDLCRMHAVLDAVAGEAARVEPARAQWLLWAVHLGATVDAAAAAWEDAGHPPLPATVWRAAADLPAWVAGWLAADADARWPALIGAPDAPAAADALLRRFGSELPEHLAASAERAPIVVRAHGLSRDAALTALRERGISAEPGLHARTAIVVPTGTNLRGLPAGLRRHLQVQDEASQLVARIVDPSAGERVLDWCAGAGGKSLALADALGGPVWATDVRGRALAEAKRRAREHGVKLRTALLRDGEPSCDLGGAFDAVLVDAPCTGTGVWRRHPELRTKLGALDELLATQDLVLDQAAAHVRRGGRLVYATCSVLPSEDEDRVTAFLARHAGWEIEPGIQVAPEVDASLFDGPFLRTSPHVHGTDGFFGAVLRRW